MAPLNKVALASFATGKLSGMVGVCLGFCGPQYHVLGGYLLGVAFVLIFSAVGCGVVQLRRDKLKFEGEDSESLRLRTLARMRSELEDNIRELESRRDDLQKLLIRR